MVATCTIYANSRWAKANPSITRTQESPVPCRVLASVAATGRIVTTRSRVLGVKFSAPLRRREAPATGSSGVPAHKEHARRCTGKRDGKKEAIMATQTVWTPATYTE